MTDARAARPRRRVLRGAGVVGLVMVLLLVGYVVVVGVLRSRTLTLPAPSGPFAVGRTIVTVPAGEAAADESRRAAWIWYPADRGSAEDAPRTDYVPEGWSGPGSLPPAVGLGWLLQDVDAVTSSASRDAAPAAEPASAVILAPGFESAPWMYTSLGEDLASRGYVVALLVPESTPARVIDGQARSSPAAATAPTGPEADPLIEEQADDMINLFDSLTSDSSPIRSAIDAQRTVFAGHSLGGGAAVRACEDEPRCVGSINMDGPQPEVRPTKPELLIGSDRSCAAVSPCAGEGLPEEYVDWLTQRRKASPPAARATITGAGHTSFGDPVHYFVAPPAGAASGVGTIPAGRMHAVLTDTIGGTVGELLDTGRLGAVGSGNAHPPELLPQPR